ncbi:MAG: hypothetical protein ACRDLR_04550, partial [Gaiellaceae bacterium]
GPDVDSLYYYLVNMKRLAVRLDELGLSGAVQDIRTRVDRAVETFTDEQHRPIVAEPGPLTRLLGPSLFRVSRWR